VTKMFDEDTMERCDVGQKEQDANMEGVKFAIDVIRKIDVYCEECQMEADACCRVNHPQKLFLYYSDLKKCLDKLERGIKNGR